MALNVSDKITQNFRQPNIAASYGPYPDTDIAMSAISAQGIACAGLTVGITQQDGSVKEYWLQPVEGQLQFVEKGGGDTSNLATKQELQQGLSGKQDTINDLSDIRSGASAGATAVQPSTLNNYVQKSQTTGLLKNDGTVDTQIAGKAASALQPKQSGQYTQGSIVIFDANGGLADSQKKTSDFATAAQGAKADNAIPMPTGTDGQILEKDSNETSGVKWVSKPSDGKSAYQLYVDGGGTLTQEQWLASLKANIGEFLFVPTDAAAVSAMATIGQTYPSAIDPQGKNVAPTQNTLSVILLMNAGTSPDKTMMIATQEATTAGTYEFIYAGDLQSAMSSNVLTEDDVDDAHLVNPISGSLAKAEDVLQLKAKLEGVTATEIKASYVAFAGYKVQANGVLSSNANAKYTTIPLNGAKSVRFLGVNLASNSSATTKNTGYCFGHYDGEEIEDNWVIDTPYAYEATATTSENKEYIAIPSANSTHLRTNVAYSFVNVDNFYCYLQSGESVGDLISDLQYQIDYVGYDVNDVTDTENIKNDYYIRYSDGYRISGSVASKFSIRWYNCQNVDRVKVYVGSDTSTLAFIAFYSSDVNPNTAAFGTYMQEPSIKSNSTTGWFEAKIPSGAKYVAISNKGAVCQEPKVLLLTKSENYDYVEQEDLIPVAEKAEKIQYVNSVDLSLLIPTGGVDGSNGYTLEMALNAVPESYQKGGLTIKFIDSVTTNYVEYRLIKSTWSTSVDDWEDVSDSLVRGNHIASTDSVINTLYGKEDDIIELSYEVTAGSATNVYKDVILKANNTYMIVYADYPNDYTLYNSVSLYNGSDIIPCYVDNGSTASSSAISMNDGDRIVRLIRPTIDSTRIRFQQAADKNTVSGTVKFRIIKLSDEKGLANIKDTVDNTSALILKQNIKNTRPYYFGEGYVGLESYINPSYLEERIKAVPEGKHFIFNTDSHIDYGRTVDQDNIGYGNLQKETEIMKYVKDRLGIRNVVFGGDCIGGVDSKYEAAQILSIYCDDKFNAFGSDFLYCQGNHDANYAQWSNHEAPVPPETDLIISDTEIYKRTTRYMKQYGKAVFDDLMLEGADKIDFSQYVDATTGVDSFGYTAEQLKEEFKAWAMLHYYYDDDVQKIRYIVLETGDFSHAYRKLVGTGAHTGMDLLNDFIARSLLTVPKDYDVVIVGHQIVYETNDEVDYTTARGLSAWIHTQMILNAYINKSYVTYRSRDLSALDFAKEMYPKLIYGDFGTNTYFGQYRKYDFSHVVGSGRIFICGGHYHANDCYMVHFSGSGSSQRVAYTEYDGSTFPESRYVLDIKFDRCVASGRSSGWVGSGSHPYATSYPNDVSSNTEPMEQRLGTVKEVLFDVVTITPDNRVVCTRFGAGGTGDSGIENQGNREFRLFAPEQSND